MGSLIFGSIDTQGQTFGDIKAQTSKAGVPRPIVFGRVRPIKGNIIAATEPEIVKRKKKKSNGWLAPSTTIRWEEVYRTYAIRICEGPVTGVRRVWEGDDLVYHRDSSDPTQIENNQAFLQKAELFLGGWDQMPSSVMQAAFGIDNVHAYRGTCYMVVDNEELTRTSGAVPQFTFEVERCEGFVITSRPYAIVAVESMASQFEQVEQSPTVTLTESVGSSFAGISGELNSIFQEYTNYEPEAVDSSFVGVTGDLNDIFQEYTNYDPEVVGSSFVGVVGEMKQTLVTYENYDAESVDSAFVGVTGALT